MWRKWIGVSYFLLVSPAHAADQLAFGPAPSWVKVETLKTVSKSNGAPLDLLLSDTQVKLEPGMVAQYAHNAVRINTPQGLSSGNVIAAWDPAFETVTFHKLIVHRGGQIVDILAKNPNFTILRREQNLAQQTLDGRLTAALQPEGLQIGDILEVQMSVVRRDPTLRGHMELTTSLNSPARIEDARLRLTTPANPVMRQRLDGGLSAPTMSRKGGEVSSAWSFAPFEPQVAPAFAPPRFANGRTLEITDFQAWNDVAALFLPLFERASAIPADDPLQQEIARIRKASPDASRRAALALQLVEEKIRYVNLALGVGGLVPASASQTWGRRFGDCKAKTALLIGLLRELGIEGVPVLVHTERGDGLNDRLPMVGLFNHVIVRARVAGKTYWLDGTRSGDAGLETLEVPYYHWGLPIVQNAELVRIMPGPRIRPDLETVIRTDASAGVSKPVPTVLDLTMRGDLAIVQNIMLSQLDPNLRDDAMRRQLQGVLDRFEIEKVSASYDQANQVYRLHGEGRQTLDLVKGIYWTEVPSLGFKADFRRSGMRDQSAPVQLSYPYYGRTVQTIVIPKDRVAQTTFQMPPIVTTVAGVEYRRTVTNAGGVVTIESANQALKPEISIDEALAAQDRLRELDKDSIWIRLSSSTPVVVAELKELIGRDPKTAADFTAAAFKYLQKKETSKAIGALDRAIEIFPSNAAPRAIRAQLKMNAGDLDGARTDANVALKADSRDVSMRRLLADIHIKAGNSDAAFAETQKLATIDNAPAQINRAQILLSLGRDREALTAFDRALSLEPDPMTHVYKARAMRTADKAARRQELDKAVALDPSDSASLAALAQLASEVGDHKQALRMLDQAFLKAPDNIDVRHSRAVQLLKLGQTDAANREFDAIGAKDLTADELNNLCWAKALANVALDRALAECDRSLAKDDSFATHDSKAAVLLRQARFDDAIREYGIALSGGDFASALYGRALAYAHKGELARSATEAARAVKISPGIERTYAHYGLTP